MTSRSPTKETYIKQKLSLWRIYVFFVGLFGGNEEQDSPCYRHGLSAATHCNRNDKQDSPC